LISKLNINIFLKGWSV